MAVRAASKLLVFVVGNLLQVPLDGYSGLLPSSVTRKDPAAGRDETCPGGFTASHREWHSAREHSKVLASRGRVPSGHGHQPLVHGVGSREVGDTDATCEFQWRHATMRDNFQFRLVGGARHPSHCERFDAGSTFAVGSALGCTEEITAVRDILRHAVILRPRSLGPKSPRRFFLSITNCGDPSSSQRAGLLRMTGREFRTYTSAQTPGCADPRRQESDRKCCPANYCLECRNSHYSPD